VLRRILLIAVATLAPILTASSPGVADSNRVSTGTSGINPDAPLWAHASDGGPPNGGPRVSASASTSPMSSSWLEGIDVSHWNGTINWSKVAASGRRFVIMKATDGRKFDDPNYASNKARASAAGLVITAYHFARPDTRKGDAVAEADHFIDVAGLRVGNIIPVLDLERDGGMSTSTLIDWTRAWLKEVKRLTRVRPMIYTGPYRWSTKMGDTKVFADHGYRLWLGHWTTGTPWVPANDWGGNGWTFWQYTNCGKVPGVGGCVDLDHYKGTKLARVRIPLLTVTKTGPGTVTSAPRGIDCGSRCRSAFDPGSVAELTANPAAGAVFVRWREDCSGAGSCTVTMIGHRLVKAVFGYMLSVSVSGTGSGTVTSTPSGIVCGAGGTKCSKPYPVGTTVTLAALPAPGSQLARWRGDCSGSSLKCTLTMDSVRSVNAKFSPRSSSLRTR
jgi:GH25 family lysozyme M1 (1,4-beta-N-acetylmuramidase)